MKIIQKIMIDCKLSNFLSRIIYSYRDQLKTECIILTCEIPFHWRSLASFNLFSYLRPLFLPNFKNKSYNVKIKIDSYLIIQLFVFYLIYRKLINPRESTCTRVKTRRHLFSIGVVNLPCNKPPSTLNNLVKFCYFPSIGR